jgi:hypothetical protein
MSNILENQMFAGATFSKSVKPFVRKRNNGKTGALLLCSTAPGLE